MKKKILSLLLVFAMLCSLLPTALAAESGFSSSASTMPSPSVGPVELAKGSETGTGSISSGFAFDTDDSTQTTAPSVTVSPAAPAAGGEDRIVESGADRFSSTEAAETYAAEDVVTLIVVMNQRPLLSTFSVSEIAQATSSVQRYEQQQMQQLSALEAKLEDSFGGEESFEIGFTYTIATTGVSITTEYGNKEEIEAMPGVDHVYVAPVFQIPEDYSTASLEPQTSNASTMIGADVLNSTGYTGKGMKVAILDTGIVVDHPSFGALSEDKLTDSSLTKESVNEIWDTLNASGTTSNNQSYYNSKIPFRFNYDGMNFDVSHTTAGSDHGTHVAGIAAANRIDSTSVVGVAPDAQLVVMQVFSRGGGANWSTIMAALEDCVRLDVDAVNLSLGMAAGFSTASGDMTAVLDEFIDKDIEVLIAAGNDTNNAYMNRTGYNMSKSGNPDTGLMGTPASYPAALAVASADNDGADQLYFTVNGRQIGYYDTAASAATKFLSNFRGQTLEFVAVGGYGEASDYEGLDVAGKVAVVSRGSTSFPDKQAAAQEAGAIACVVYNNAPGLLMMQISDGNGYIPCISISNSDGQYLAELASGSLTVCDGDLIHVSVGQSMSSFSSWGVLPDLGLKPEITGVGGGIYSSVDPSISGSNYGSMSGTSMATPQITGAMAVLMQYLREHYSYTEGELRRVAANLMMSTADPMTVGGLEYSPRYQGAGLANLVDATSAQAYLSNPDATEGRPKGEMGDDPAKSGVYSFPFTITNISDEEQTFSFDASVMTADLFVDESGAKFMSNDTRALDASVTVSSVGGQIVETLKYDFNDDGEITTADARVLLRHIHGLDTIGEDNVHYAYLDVNGDGQVDKRDVIVITDYCAELEVSVDLLDKTTSGQAGTLESIVVPAGETVELQATVTLTGGDKQFLNQFENGMYVEGFLYVNAQTEGGVDLSMPFLGFYGDWSDAPVFDEPGEDASLYKRLVYTNNSQLGTNPYIRGGKSGDQYNAFSYANPLAEIDFGMLRNARKMSFTVTDATTGVEYYSLSGELIAKSYYNASYGMVIPFYVVTEEGEVWDGKDQEGKQLPSGTRVNYKVEAWLDDGDEIVDDTFSFGVTVDTKMPEILNQYELQDALNLNEEEGKVELTLELLDDLYIAAVLFVSPEGIVMGRYEVDNTPGETYTKTYDITGYGTDFTIVVADYACNEAEIDVSLDLGDMSDVIPARKTLDPGRLYGCETFDGAAVDAGWFSANKADLSDPKNETFDNTAIYYSGEYVNGYVVAQQASDGAIVLLTPQNTFWNSTTLVTQNASIGRENSDVLYDMALDYSGKYASIVDRWESAAGTDTLFAVGWHYAGDTDGDGKDNGYNALYRIWVSRWNQQAILDEVGRITGTDGGAEILTLGCTTEGDLYGIDTDAKLYSLTVNEDQSCTAELIGQTDFAYVANYSGTNVIQSMGYDHNTGTMYWYAHSQTVYNNSYLNINMTYKVNLEDASCERVGTYGPGGETALFVPCDLESDLFAMGVNPERFNISPYEMTMAVGQRKRLSVNWEPWNAKTNEITWSSDDEDVVTVNSAGFVTAVAEGEAVITATGQVWDAWAGDYDYETGTYPGAWVDYTATCQIRVVGSNEGIYSFIVADYNDSSNNQQWFTFSDQAPGMITRIGQAKGEYLWEGGAYYNGYVYTNALEEWSDGVYVYRGNALYKSKVTPGETPDKTVIGEPELVGRVADAEIGNMGFDYNTGRMYGADYKNGGLAIIDLDTGAVDSLGSFSGDIASPLATALCVTADGTIVAADMYGSLYTVDCDTLSTKRIGSVSDDCWFYAAMTYDYDTGNIYWNPCMNSGLSPLYLVRLDADQWSGELTATIVDLGDVSSKYGVEQTVMFTIPTNEPETKHIPVEGIEITNGETATGLVGGHLKLETVTTPARPTVQARTWESSNPGVVSVDAAGNLSFNAVGTATVTVTIANKDVSEGGPFSDSIAVTVYEAAGKLDAFIAYDESATGYYEYWLDMYDYDIQNSVLETRALGVYNMRSGAYYDGYFYGYNADLKFIRVSNENRLDYAILSNGVAEGLTATDSYGYVAEQVTGMDYDYITSTMYGLTLPVNGQNGYLASIDLDTGAVTKLAQLDQKVFALAIDQNGTLYAAGSVDYGSDAVLYTVDKDTGACTAVMTLTGARVYTGANNYGDPYYNAQMTCDFTTGRLYLNATYKLSGVGKNTGFYMIDLENNLLVNLGKPALYREGREAMVGDLHLGLLCAIPENSELPESGVTGMLLSKESARVPVGGTMELTARVRPSNAANQEVVWESSDESIVTVENGVVYGVSAGTATITVTSVDNTSVSASCEVTAVSLDGPQSTAYTVSSRNDSLVRFNPEVPGEAEVVSSFSGGTTINGMAMNGDSLWYIQDGSLPMLYSYDPVTKQSVYYGQLYTFGEVNDMAYDPVGNMIYVTSGFYVFQFDVSRLTTASLNWYSEYRDISSLSGIPSTHGVTFANGSVYFLGKGYYGCNLYRIALDATTGVMSSPELVISDLAVSTDSKATELAYDSSRDVFYVTDAADRLYSFDWKGNVTLIDSLGDGLDINGLAIAVPAEDTEAAADAVLEDGQEPAADETEDPSQLDEAEEPKEEVTEPEETPEQETDPDVAPAVKPAADLMWRAVVR